MACDRCDEIERVPLAAAEVAVAREHRTIKWLIIGWAASMLAMAAVMYALATAEVVTTTETTTTETATQTADSGDNGTAVANGDGEVNVG